LNVLLVLVVRLLMLVRRTCSNSVGLLMLR
jgi:hypothetical protein